MKKDSLAHLKLREAVHVLLIIRGMIGKTIQAMAVLVGNVSVWRERMAGSHAVKLGREIDPL